MSSVLILLAVYQGEKFLKQQLDSIANQTINNIHILASDDGSSDGSVEILEVAKKSWEKGIFKIVKGPQKGVEENFRSLILNEDIEADYYAFSDQDDIWDSDKLEKAIKWSSSQDANLAQTYGGRTRAVDEVGKYIGLSPLFAKPASFQNALVQNIAGGNTMVLNKKAHDLIRETARRTGFVSHDWWVYQIITGSGGLFYYHSEPTISYRQHEANLVGSNNSIRARMIRVRRGFKGQMRIWSKQNIASLEACSDLLTPEAKSSLKYFKLAHNSDSLFKRFLALRKSGVYRQTINGKISLHVACFLKLI